jgi:2'-5' RNA ligase
MYRLFVAIDLPDTVRQSIAAIRRDIHGVRWVPLEQLHLTLRFIGDADDDLFNGVKNSLSKITFPPFEMRLARVGHFPPGKPARIVWVGVEQRPELLLLQKEVEVLLVNAGIPPEPRPFSPHITLARIREPRPGLTLRLEEEQGSFSVPPFSVTEFHLYSSLLDSSGAIHTKEATYPLSMQGAPTTTT